MTGVDTSAAACYIYKLIVTLFYFLGSMGGLYTNVLDPDVAKLEMVIFRHVKKREGAGITYI